MFRYLVLGLLRDGGVAHHGYALMKAYEKRSGIRISSGNFYRELGRLVAEGLVRATVNPPGTDARRTPYEITGTGADLFDQWFSSRPADPSDSDDELAGRAIFFPEADPLAARRIIDHWRETLWLRSKTLERERKAALAEDVGNGRNPFGSRALLISRRLAHVAADIEFLERLSSAYEEWVVSKERQFGRAKQLDRKAKEPLRK